MQGLRYINGSRPPKGISKDSRILETETLLRESQVNFFFFTMACGVTLASKQNSAQRIGKKYVRLSQDSRFENHHG